ncbi:E3 ubiquitin-protein ligase ARIH1-like [Nasonia vitripennis]|uniref:RBR-type E3 ubiquitin transferase n=1 Tax=Nasonia vitripennis TaxID=7425 RepID=A0A7M7R0C0_NASVI|nr:E3 ubiquitin-protein ligase ARIH1-like [Nasonia vitripennis]
MDSDGEICYDEFNEQLDFGYEFYGNVIEKPEAAEYPYEVLSTEEIVEHMVDTIKKVNTVVRLPATTTRILLNHFKWDTETLVEKFYDEDQEKLFAEARVVSPFKKQPVINITCSLQNLTTKSNSDEEEECGVCFMTLPTDEMSGLECGHRFCTNCWREYFQTKIMGEGQGQKIPCAAHDCEILVDDATIMRLVEDPKVKLKYQHLITNSFVVCNRLLKWCRTADCNHAIKVQYVESKPVTCKCNNTFCFSCGEDWHDPITCDLLRKWIKKCNDDSETSNWFAANTKECINCKTKIEKNGGCNRIVCSNQNCKMEFCWACLKSWKLHGYGGYCNEYDEVNGKKSREISKADLQRYLFYCERYTNHMQSLKFEKKLYEKLKKKKEETPENNMSWMDVQFLTTATDVLCSCRQTLIYTYVFAFYLKKNNQSQIFNDNHSDLERATETLSGFLERDITGEDVRDIKLKVLDKYQYCESRRKVLSDFVKEGFEKELWEFID